MAESKSGRVICHCAGITDKRIGQYRRDHPEAPPESVCQALGCAVQCGSCRPAVLEILGHHAWWSAGWQAVRHSTGHTADHVQRAIYRITLTPGADDSYPLAAPGQHVIVRATMADGAVERSFTIVAQDPITRVLSLAIRRVPGGALTPGLTASDVPVAVEISAPSGRPFDLEAGRPVVFLAGGIGITPAISLFKALPAGATGCLDWSILHAGDAVLGEEREAIAQRHPDLETVVRDVSKAGLLDATQVQRIVDRFPGARFVVCGPTGYLAMVQEALREAGVPPSDVTVEKFHVPAAAEHAARGKAQDAGRAKARAKGWSLSFRWKAYLAGLALAGTSGLILSQAPESVRPHGAFNVGHAELDCVQCHEPAPGTTRQVLQAKARELIGLRESPADFGKKAVTNPTCVGCHANFDDRHAPSRFLEPRFDQAREETGAHQCVSCHREHRGLRIAAPSTTFCASCHTDTEVKNDPVQPTHQALIEAGRWETCLQCHDYHGNHRWEPPLRLDKAIALPDIDAYFKHDKAPSPYGDKVIEALDQPRKK